MGSGLGPAPCRRRACGRQDRGKEKTVKLYSMALSPYSARVRASIYAKGLPVEIVLPPTDWRTSSEFRAINPLAAFRSCSSTTV
jgi:hypothetical protein